MGNKCYKACAQLGVSVTNLVATIKKNNAQLFCPVDDRRYIRVNCTSHKICKSIGMITVFVMYLLNVLKLTAPV